LTLNQGQLHEAEALCRSALTEYVDRRGKRLPILGMIYSPLASICYEKGSLAEAQEFAQTGTELCQRLFSSSIMGKDNEIVLARIAIQRGEAKQAFQLLQATAESARQNNMMMVVYKMAIIEVELHLAQGNLPEAEIGLNKLNALVQSNLLKAEHVVAHLHARYLTASGRFEEAFEILKQLEQADQEEGSIRRLMSVYITEALIYEKQSNMEQATRAFESALRLAASEGYKITFFPQKDRQTRHLLQVTRSVAPTFVDSILEATRSADDFSAQLPDPLSEQEIRVLKLIVAGKSNQEIAEELVISPGTAKWHVHNILQKLGVENRAQAIVRARELGIE
jgi:LuxR family maltose regulon positive regulatory protein